MKTLRKDAILWIENTLFLKYGNMGWWPAESPDEVAIGAILTQNTSWKNVEKSIAELRAFGMLDLNKLAAADKDVLARLTRSSGFYNIKSARLISISKAILNEGGFSGLRRLPTESAEKFLLSLKGIGPETAESIMCYILERNIFVIDKYTLRIFSRIGLDTSIPRLRIRETVEFAIRDCVSLKNFHATLVKLAKDYCRSTPICKGCPLEGSCEHAQRITSP